MSYCSSGSPASDSSKKKNWYWGVANGKIIKGEIRRQGQGEVKKNEKED